MAKRSKRGRRARKFRRYLKGSIDEELSLTTLAAKAVAAGNMDETVNERTWCSSVKATWAMQRYTRGLDDGPILCGLAHADYTAAEIEEWIENTGSWNEGDLVNQEVAKRKIRRVGVFDAPDDANSPAVLNEGRAIRTKTGWILNQGETLKIWAYNMGSSALATTVPLVIVQGHANLWPL